MVLLLLTFCLLLLPLWESVIVLRFVILMGKRELVALLNLSSWCLVMVEGLFLTVPRGCLQFVIVVCPDHTHLLFLHNNKKQSNLNDSKIVNKYDQEIPQLQIAEKPMVPRGRLTKQSRDTRQTY